MSAPKQTIEDTNRDNSHLMAGQELGIMEGNSLPGAMQTTTWTYERSHVIDSPSSFILTYPHFVSDRGTQKRNDPSKAPVPRGLVDVVPGATHS